MPQQLKTKSQPAIKLAIEEACLRFATADVVPLKVFHIPTLRPRQSGPWINEADKIAWTDPATGLACIIRRSIFGHLCGYVAVEAGHPLYGFAHDALPHDLPLTVHGGLVYARRCDSGRQPTTAIRRETPRLGLPSAWWYGFECNHSFDVVPSQSGPAIGIDENRFARALAGSYGRASCHNDGCGCPPRIADTVFTGLECAPVYRDEAYVYRQCVNLAAQLDAIDNGLPLPVFPSTPPLGFDPVKVGGGR